MNKTGNANESIWWGFTGIFVGHSHPISSMAMLCSPCLLRLLLRDREVEDGNDNLHLSLEEKERHGTMLVSSCEDGWIRVWDAFDASHGASKNNINKDISRSPHGRRIIASGRKGSMKRQDLIVNFPCQSRRNRNTSREPMWEIDVNFNSDGDTKRGYSEHIGVTSLSTLQAETLIAAGTTDGKIRIWNVSSGLFKGSYNLGRSVQVWSTCVLSDCIREEDNNEYGCSFRRERKVCMSAGTIVSGDNRGQVRVTDVNF